MGGKSVGKGKGGRPDKGGRSDKPYNAFNDREKGRSEKASSLADNHQQKATRPAKLSTKLHVSGVHFIETICRWIDRSLQVKR